MESPPSHRLRLTTFLVTCASAWERKAISQVKRVLPQATCRTVFMPGNLIVNTEASRDEALRLLDEADTTVIGRIVPLDLRVDIGKDATSLDLLLAASLQLPPCEPEGSFRVVCHRRGEHDFGSRDVEHHVGTRFSDHWGLTADLELPDQVLCIEIFQNLAFVGLCWPEELLRKEIVQMHRSTQRPLNRAELKLREAYTEFGLDPGPETRALDLGAAPGGWSRVLAETCREVVAVDPAALDERVSALSNVTHVRARAESYLAEAAGTFGLITCDMNLHPVDAATLMARAAALLPPGAPAIMTVKFQTRRRRKHVEEVLAVLTNDYDTFSVRHLPHNGKETTLFMRRRGQ